LMQQSQGPRSNGSAPKEPSPEHQILLAGCCQKNAHCAAMSNQTADRQQTPDYIDGISYGFG
jgi:hypothetical protein